MTHYSTSVKMVAMSILTREDVVKIAKLSRLALTDEEIDAYTGEIASILQYIDKLQAVDTDSLEPTYQVTGLTNVMRADEIIDYGASQAELMKNAPSTEKNQFRVKRMVG